MIKILLIKIQYILVFFRFLKIICAHPDMKILKECMWYVNCTGDTGTVH